MVNIVNAQQNKIPAYKEDKKPKNEVAEGFHAAF